MIADCHIKLYLTIIKLVIIVNKFTLIRSKKRFHTG